MTWAAVSISLLGSLAYFAYLINKKGLDPSLITQSSVFAVSNYWPARVFLAAAVAGYMFYASAGRFLSYLLVAQSLFQIFILILFGRHKTQPLIYFIIVAAAVFTALLPSPQIGGLLIISGLLLGECYLFWWRKHRHRIYNRWVERTASRIDSRFRGSAGKLNRSQWSWVLHAATTEAIARPAVVRLMERIYFILFRPPYISTGIMQTASSRPLSNAESIRAGAKKVVGILQSMPAGLDHPTQLRWFAKRYNGSFGYANYLRMTYPGVENALKNSP